MKKYILINYIMDSSSCRTVIVAKRKDADRDITIIKNIKNKGCWREGEETRLTPYINTVTFESDDLQEVIDMGMMEIL